ncbi:MAG: hypothetical protein ABI557_16970, partial [Aureliella sp.]
MPGTASTRNIDGDRLRSRPVVPRSARPAAAADMPSAGTAAELPPILFRLPALTHARLDAERQVAEVEQASAATDAQVASSLDTPNSTSPSSLASDNKSLDDSLPPDSISPSHVHQATIETFAAPSSFVNANISEAATASAVSAVAAPVSVPNGAANRTWWEHWSS